MVVAPVVTVATPTLPLVHPPPPVVVLKVVVNPAHTISFPVIALGSGYTVTIAVAIQPVLSV